ncbi:hypothetical protein MJO28_015450 [Puccinia striiformis f. sp. tritici]|uniref:Uncharacterized protein n=1 Tax=Puccinia striiformis f. sp. tritici TaxID=168172 RepID=A0ACC0DSY7_9BASI|nr:hypothetical protein MJO28_015450 [Puccinia striiformis f. sp. tritici]
MLQHVRWITLLVLIAACEIICESSTAATSFQCPRKENKAMEPFCVDENPPDVTADGEKVMAATLLRAKGRFTCTVLNFKGKCCLKGVIKPIPGQDPTKAFLVQPTVIRANCSPPPEQPTVERPSSLVH